MKSQLNWNNKITEIQIIISIVRVSEHFAVGFEWSIYKNCGCYELREPRLYACQLHTHSCLHYALSNQQPIKNVSCFCLDMAQ
jgi:hypothetical protein